MTIHDLLARLNRGEFREADVEISNEETTVIRLHKEWILSRLREAGVEIPDDVVIAYKMGCNNVATIDDEHPIFIQFKKVTS